jgi:DNA adenine methylase
MMTALLTQKTYKPPFPWFGGKSKVAPEVWRRFGTVRNFIEPFCGSMAMLMLRPQPFVGTETCNDADGFICNFWRSVKAAPDAVAEWADRPVNENDLHAIHVRLRDDRSLLTSRLEGDPDYFDPKIAGWWAWGQCCWIGSGWCDEGRQGPWSVVIDDDGLRQLVHLGDAGRGVNRKRVHLGDAGRGVNRQLVHLGDAGQGVNRKRVHLGDAGQGSTANGLAGYFATFCNRIRRVRVCCGDWTRVCGYTPTIKQGLTAVFLDPPYSDSAKRTDRLYSKDSLSVAHKVREWAIERGDDQRLRICLAGYAGEHSMPRNWSEWAWKAKGGYGSQSKVHDNPNARRERLWFSPHCLD